MVITMKFKKIIITTVIILIITISSFSIYTYNNIKINEKTINNIKRNNKKLASKEKKLINIKENYNKTVKTKQKSYIYKQQNNKYEKIGTIKKDVILELETIENIGLDNAYFKILNSDYYILYKDVIKNFDTFNKRYLNYIEFPLEINTKENIKYYDDTFNELFTLNDSITAKVIVNLDNYYGIDLLSRLVFIKKEDIANEKEITTNTEIAESIPAILYHFIYLNNDNSCNDIICHSEEQIDSHFKFLADNNVLTLTTDEVLKFIKGEINLPKKSILITIDDGARAENFIPFLEKYGLNATLFLVSSWYPVSKFSSPYLEIASHTHNMHTTGICPTGQGGGINCLPPDEILNDLKLSRETLNNTKAFCFPFYEYSNYSINLVKEAGFDMAFIGGSTKIKKGIDPYKIPRYPILSSFGIDYISNLILS